MRMFYFPSGDVWNLDHITHYTYNEGWWEDDYYGAPYSPEKTIVATFINGEKDGFGHGAYCDRYSDSIDSEVTILTFWFLVAMEDWQNLQKAQATYTYVRERCEELREQERLEWSRKRAAEAAAEKGQAYFWDCEVWPA